MNILIEFCRFFPGSSSLILLKSNIKDDDTNNRGCKNTTICVISIEAFIYDIFRGMPLNKNFT
jgi:hypothetical protein